MNLTLRFHEKLKGKEEVSFLALAIIFALWDQDVGLEHYEF